MRRFLNLLVVLAVCVIAIGLYFKWFTISASNGTGGDNTMDVRLSVDPDKAKADTEAFTDKAKDFAGNDD